MDRIRIVGGQPLEGNIQISGAKNAALPLMIASLLTDETLTLENTPSVADVGMLLKILSHHGVDYSVDGRKLGDDPHAARTLHLSAISSIRPRPMISSPRCGRAFG
jgi:UDP-N-acetylglucosamine 1-carboxyvinyltransferase